MPSFQAFEFKWRREARLLRERAKSLSDLITADSAARICEARANAIEQVLSDLPDAALHFEVRRRPGDGRHCVYLRKTDVVVAEFTDDATGGAEEFREMFGGD